MMSPDPARCHLVLRVSRCWTGLVRAMWSEQAFLQPPLRSLGFWQTGTKNSKKEMKQ